MLEFFRKYQKYFFFVITIVIIISFSFFGTYSAFTTKMGHEIPVFTAVDGKVVSRADLDEMALFLSTDAQDKLMYGGAWGPNFFNNGVIQQDFLATGLAEILVDSYAEDIKPDLQTRLDKEKRYTLYSHPQGKFVSVENAWKYVAPEMKDYYGTLIAQNNPLTPEAFAARVNLFLGEKKFPSPLLRQVLQYQQRQYNWLMPDENLDRIDLSLFGYHTVEDWFGPRFIRLVSQFIINASKIAEQKGYVVTKEEALADLMQNARQSFDQNKGSPYLGVASYEEYVQEQLHRMGMDQNKAVKVWTQVLLFRRLFHDFGDSVLVDGFAYRKLMNYSKEYIEGDFYRLPKSLQLTKNRDLQKLEMYIKAVGKRSAEGKELQLPTEYLKPVEVAKNDPELVQKRFLLSIASVDKNALQAKVGVKETWNWEVDDANWAALKKQFPELGVKKGETRDERFAALDSLNPQTRSAVDMFARKAIVDNHPEWLDQALKDAVVTDTTIGIRKKGGTLPIEGLEDRESLIRLLDTAPMSNAENATLSKSAQEAQEKLSRFTPDQRHYYKIRVISRAPDEEILTFEEASRDGTLENVLNRRLEAYYVENRQKNPELFQKADQTWKDFAEVSTQVSDLMFAKDKGAVKGDDKSKNLLYAYVKTVEKEVEKNPKEASKWYKEPQEAPVALDTLAPAPSLKDQWKLEKSTQRLERSAKKDPALHDQALFALTIQEWSPVYATADGDIFFFQLEKKGNAADDKVIGAKVEQAHAILSADAQRMLMYQVLQQIKTKNAISFDYLQKKDDEG